MITSPYKYGLYKASYRGLTIIGGSRELAKQSLLKILMEVGL